MVTSAGPDGTLLGMMKLICPGETYCIITGDPLTEPEGYANPLFASTVRNGEAVKHNQAIGAEHDGFFFLRLRGAVYT